MIERVRSYDELVTELNRLISSGACVNSLPDREALEAEISMEQLWAERLPEGLLLLRRIEGIQRLRFLLRDPLALRTFIPDRPTSLELPFRKGDPRFPDLARELENAGWRIALRRVRLSRKNSDAVPEIQTAPAAELPSSETLSALLHVCFSPLTGCLPDAAELEEDLAQGRLLFADGGLIRWRQKGRVSEIRHLAVAPERRGCGTGKKLVASYVALSQGKNCRVWTGADNAPALDVYRSFGYSEDGWESLVLLSGEYLLPVPDEAQTKQ